MSKLLKIAPWLGAAIIAWLVGFVYNVYYGGELSWLRAMYFQKVALASQIRAPRRLIVMGGSGAHHSINSKILEQELGIPVMNMGLDGPVGLNVILPSVLEVVSPGDVVLLIPEDLILIDEDGLLDRSASFGIAIGRAGLGGVPPKQLAREFLMLGVPTLRASAKSAMDLVKDGRMTGYYSDPITKRGDPTVTKLRRGEWWQMSIQKPISKHAIARITQFKEEVEAKEASLVLSLPWVYADTEEKTVNNMRETVQSLDRIAPLVYDGKSYNLKADVRLFADTHHHLVPDARKTRSMELAQQLSPVLEHLKNPNTEADR